MTAQESSVATVASRRFHLSEGASHKFWSVQVEGVVQTVRFGRIGSDGQTCVKSFSNPAEAAEATEQLIGQKRKKGYHEVSPEEVAQAIPRKRPASRRLGQQMELPF